MLVQQKEWAIQQDPMILDNECKICYLEMDAEKLYPMLVCAAQHLVCHSCFLELAKSQRFLQCPFCKRNTDIQNINKFRYALAASAQYAKLKKKYFVLLDKLNQGKSRKQDEEKHIEGRREGDMQLKQLEEQYPLTLANLWATIQKLKVRLKKSQIRNTQLCHQIELQHQRYTTFQIEINVCKFNDLIMRNKVTMFQYQLKKLEREKQALTLQCGKLKTDLFDIDGKVASLMEINQQLLKENLAWKSQNHDNSKDDSQECPEVEDTLSNDLTEWPLLIKKKSKSAYLKEQEKKRTFITRKSQKKQKPKIFKPNPQLKLKFKDQCGKLEQKKSHKIFKNKGKQSVKQ